MYDNIIGEYQLVRNDIALYVSDNSLCDFHKNEIYLHR